MKLQAELERRVHRAKPATAAQSGDDLLADLMSRIGGDACQRATPDLGGTPEAWAGYAHDPVSMRALRYLDRVMRSMRVRTV